MLFQELEKEVEAHLKVSHKIKKLSKDQKEVSTKISEVIIANELPENWKNSVSEYCSSPIDKNLEMVKEVSEIALEHQVNTFMGSVLYHSKTN